MSDTATEHPTERWIAIGTRRGQQSGKRGQAFLDPHGKELFYIERASYIVGGIYDVEVERTDGRTTRWGTPKYAGPSRDDRTAEWQAAEAADEARLAEAARERKAKDRDALTEAMDPLLEIAAKMRTGAQRDAFIATVIRRLTVTW